MTPDDTTDGQIRVILVILGSLVTNDLLIDIEKIGEGGKVIVTYTIDVPTDATGVTADMDDSPFMAATI